jgi:hypothetical protein
VTEVTLPDLLKGSADTAPAGVLTGSGVALNVGAALIACRFMSRRRQENAYGF